MVRVMLPVLHAGRAGGSFDDHDRFGVENRPETVAIM
jgi:hypothetical protein